MANPSGLVPLPRSVRTLIPGARAIGPANPDQIIRVSIRLRRARPATSLSMMPAFGSPSLRERSYLNREEFADVWGASTEDTGRVREFATRFGLTVDLEDRARRTVVVSGPVRSFRQAFAVDLGLFVLEGKTYRGRAGPIHIPHDLEGIVEGIFGLDDRPQARPHCRLRPATAATGQAYRPGEVAQAYNFPQGFDGRGQCVALLEFGGGYLESDLTTYFASLGVAQPKVTSVSVDGGVNAPGTDGATSEVELDIELVGALAPGAQIAVYFAPGSDQGFLDALTTAVHDTVRRPSVVSISWGFPEDAFTQQFIDAFDSTCQDAAALGVSVLAASGDSGARDDPQSTALVVDFPAACPHALGCGGTRLTVSPSNPPQETVWNDLAVGEGASGGGVSELVPLPGYQAQSAVPKAPNGFSGRGVPDVAGDADPETGYRVFVHGRETVIGGTSAVAPLWAALLARINEALGIPVGYPNPVLYSAKALPTFRDVTVGNNGGYAAGPGWDPCTGLGTPNGNALLASLRAT